MIALQCFLRKFLQPLYSVLSPHYSGLSFVSSILSPQHLYLRLFIIFLPFALSLTPLASAASAATVTLAWDPNTEPDLEGYVIYRNAGSPGPPHDYSDRLPEDELDDPLDPGVTFTDLKDGTKYYIAVTAYDSSGTEGDFSNEVCVQVTEDSAEVCSESPNPGSGSNSGSGGGSGGGGGGCFISTSANGSSSNLQVSFLRKLISHALAIIFLLLLVIRSACTPHIGRWNKNPVEYSTG